jgi:hypothetical protein
VRYIDRRPLTITALALRPLSLAVALQHPGDEWRGRYAIDRACGPRALTGWWLTLLLPICRDASLVPGFRSARALLERGAAIPSSPTGPAKTGPCAIHHDKLGAVVSSGVAARRE